jgi:hypothetical protein
LKTNTIDLGTVLLNELDDSLGTCCLGAGGFNVIVVVVELNSRVCGGGGGKCNWNVGLADGLVEDTGAVGTILIES